MKKNWNTPLLVSVGTAADLTQGKSTSGTDAFIGSIPGEVCLAQPTPSQDCVALFP